MIDIEKYFPKEHINIHYFNRYKKFIDNIYAKGRRELDYKERHHIIPKCINESMYKNNANKINLTAREHFIAHKILAYCYEDNSYYNNKLVCAWFSMSKLKMSSHKRDFSLTSRDYTILRQKYSVARKFMQKELIKSDKYINFIGKGKPASNKGMIWITDGVNNAYIHKDVNIPKGWHKGSTQNRNEELHSKKLKDAWKRNRDNRIGENHPMFGKGYLLKGNPRLASTKCKKCMTNGEINKYVNLEEIDYYKSIGFTLGQCRKNNIVKGMTSYMYNEDTDTVKLVLKSEISKYILEGWILGNPHSACKGEKNGAWNKICINNGIINKRVKLEDLEKYLNTGWIKGWMKRT